MPSRDRSPKVGLKFVKRNFKLTPELKLIDNPSCYLLKIHRFYAKVEVLNLSLQRNGVFKAK